MTQAQFLKNLHCPCPTPDSLIDVVLDTDAANEADDQYAIAYLLRSADRLRVRGLCAAPFFGPDKPVATIAQGIDASCREIRRVLALCGREDLNDSVYPGSTAYLGDETAPVDSPASRYIARLAREYSPEHPLYVVCIGAITNVASALLLDPCVRENTVTAL